MRSPGLPSPRLRPPRPLCSSPQEFEEEEEVEEKGHKVRVLFYEQVQADDDEPNLPPDGDEDLLSQPPAEARGLGGQGGAGQVEEEIEAVGYEVQHGYAGSHAMRQDAVDTTATSPMDSVLPKPRSDSNFAQKSPDKGPRGLQDGPKSALSSTTQSCVVMCRRGEGGEGGGRRRRRRREGAGRWAPQQPFIPLRVRLWMPIALSLSLFFFLSFCRR